RADLQQDLVLRDELKLLCIHDIFFRDIQLALPAYRKLRVLHDLDGLAAAALLGGILPYHQRPVLRDRLGLLQADVLRLRAADGLGHRRADRDREQAAYRELHRRADRFRVIDGHGLGETAPDVYGHSGADLLRMGAVDLDLLVTADGLDLVSAYAERPIVEDRLASVTRVLVLETHGDRLVVLDDESEVSLGVDVHLLLAEL